MGQHSLTRDPSGVNLVQKLGDARCRPEQPKPRTAEEIGRGICPFSPARGLQAHCKLPHWGPGRSPGVLAIFVDFSTQEAIFPFSWSFGYTKLLIILTSEFRSVIISADFLFFFILYGRPME